MNPEEAISYLNDPIGKGLNVHDKAVELAIQALEKQMVKKPIDIYNRVPLIIIYCPECERNLTDEYGNRYEYCPDCGTPIDWSEEE